MIQYTEEDYKKIRKYSIETLKEFIRICEKHDLTYFAISGTAIGAVRHQGFIPWDDDMDVGMLREDYDRFLEAAKEEMDERYELYSAPIQKQVQGFYLQMFPKGSVFMTKWNQKWPLHPGIKLDIFPYDNVPASGRERARLYRALRFWNRLYIIKNTGVPYFEGNSLKVKLIRTACRLGYYIMRAYPSVDMIVRKYEKLMYKYAGTSGYYTILDDMDPDLWVIREEELYPLKKAAFEDVQVHIPAKNDEMLRRQYGDYMQLPPEDERRGHEIVALVFPEEQE